MFQPYNLTMLDHLPPRMHLNPYFTFNLIGKDRVQVFQRVEDATSRLASKFPFLAGVVVPSTQPVGRSNAFQVRPATAAELEECPMLVIQHHANSTALSVEGKFNPALVPFPLIYPNPSPSPVLRLKFNVIGDKLHMVWCFDHRVVDGSGVFFLFYTFAAFCRDLNAPEPTTIHAQEKIRQHIEEIATTSTPLDLQMPASPPPTSEDEVPTGFSRVPISSRYVLDGQKIELLHEACNSAIRSLPETYKKNIPNLSLPPSMVVTALVGICSTRARLRAFPDDRELTSEIAVAANIRKAIDLPPAYLGNAIMNLQSTCDSSAHPPPDILQKIHVPGPLSPIGPEDIWQICNVVQTLQEGSRLLDKEFAQRKIATMVREHDWSSIGPKTGANFIVSDISAAKPYANFGPLGDLQLFDLPFDTFAGICWIMPNLPSDPKSSSCWRLRVALERAAMECLSSDPLFRWASTPSTASRQTRI
ncbi:uncharacterized protein N7479_004721 [Penicillium vulpinum]|uniref:Condensation domain-containing protein n=1 Tax=Penicillium vulpinum TaxID=29845 RepID=A0A1V6RSP0_9EURO|nr:uncharacterized protein N7479_004721 [Penicillium vulpinum]KAJ5964845.1 hypothetical protein N7479_004721 [Penicillium vulpinum]OQE04646.1 hypothetical protein PENVUL_c031G05815 [Penicillium vulpinum]